MRLLNKHHHASSGLIPLYWNPFTIFHHVSVCLSLTISLCCTSCHHHQPHPEHYPRCILGFGMYFILFSGCSYLACSNFSLTLLCSFFITTNFFLLIFILAQKLLHLRRVKGGICDLALLFTDYISIIIIMTH